MKLNKIVIATILAMCVIGFSMSSVSAGTLKITNKNVVCTYGPEYPTMKLYQEGVGCIKDTRLPDGSSYWLLNTTGTFDVHVCKMDLKPRFLFAPSIFTTESGNFTVGPDDFYYVDYEHNGFWTDVEIKVHKFPS